jgi:hypothetical protein
MTAERAKTAQTLLEWFFDNEAQEQTCKYRDVTSNGEVA